MAGLRLIAAVLVALFLTGSHARATGFCPENLKKQTPDTLMSLYKKLLDSEAVEKLTNHQLEALLKDPFLIPGITLNQHVHLQAGLSLIQASADENVRAAIAQEFKSYYFKRFNAAAVVEKVAAKAAHEADFFEKKVKLQMKSAKQIELAGDMLLAADVEGRICLVDPASKTATELKAIKKPSRNNVQNFVFDAHSKKLIRYNFETGMMERYALEGEGKLESETSLPWQDYDGQGSLVRRETERSAWKNFWDKTGLFWKKPEIEFSAGRARMQISEDGSEIHLPIHRFVTWTKKGGHGDIISWRQDSEILIVDAKTLAVKRVLGLPGVKVEGFQETPERLIALTDELDFNTTTKRTYRRYFSKHGSESSEPEYLTDGIVQWISKDGTIVVSNEKGNATGLRIYFPDQSYKKIEVGEQISQVAFSEDGKYIAAALYGSAGRVYRLDTGEVVGYFSLSGEDYSEIRFMSGIKRVLELGSDEIRVSRVREKEKDIEAD